MVSFCLIWWPLGNPGNGQFRSLQNHDLALLKDRSLSFVFVVSQLSKRLIISSVGVTWAQVGSILEDHFPTLLLKHPVLSSQTSIICPNATARGQQTEYQTTKVQQSRDIRCNLQPQSTQFSNNSDTVQFDTIFQQFWHCATLSWDSQRSMKCNFAAVKGGSWQQIRFLKFEHYFDTTVFGQFLAGSASVRRWNFFLSQSMSESEIQLP